MEELWYKTWKLVPSSLIVANYQDWPDVVSALKEKAHPADYYGPISTDYQLPNIASVRSLRDSVSTTPQGLIQVAVIPFAHQLSKEVANSLLKLLEEPPPQTYIILLAEHANLLPTVRSRVSVYYDNGRTLREEENDIWSQAFVKANMDDKEGRQKGERLQIYHALLNPGLKSETILEPYCSA